MPCYRSRMRFVSSHTAVYDEIRQNPFSSVHVPAGDLPYAARHGPYYHTRRFMFEPGNVDLPVPRAPVIVPRDVIENTFNDLFDEFKLDDEGVEDEDEDDNVMEVNHVAPLDLAYGSSLILLAFFLCVFHF
ncbi:hypothetical protein IW261DRAFT_1561518 [Armillaria novae-zelandiae]|uniref:Uncharacterized protein n=1 Tax=Armillaria novae-zelandiae TaxID=153914 RepID=A0AA39ULI1_9AGAR|nr:hypothetical protein IW261DRAFT_1561518 [Armillaria novae-zelandiae]